MTSLARAVARSRSGVYQLDSGRVGELSTLARDSGLGVHRVELADATDKSTILEAFSHEFRFPDWFGENWDALQDALCDLSWLPRTRGVVLVVETLEATRSVALDELLDVLRSVARYWDGADRPFLAVVAGPDDRGLPHLR